MKPAIKASIPIVILAIVVGFLYWKLTEGNPINPERIVAGDSFFYSQGRCFGACPMFEITVRSDDSYFYNGQGFVGKEGVWEGSFSEGRYRSIMALLEKYDFASLLDHYGWNGDAGGSVCGNIATDMPDYQIKLKSRRLTKQVYYYEGCMDFADEARLKALIADLQDTVDLNYWLDPAE